MIGGGVGAIFGLATYKKPNSDDIVRQFYQQLFDFGPGGNALVGGVVGAIPGAIIGGIIKSKSEKFFIHRNKENFENMRSTILEMTLSKNDYMTKDSSTNSYVAPSNN